MYNRCSYLQAEVLIYPSNNLAIDIVLLLLLVAIEIFRIYFGKFTDGLLIFFIRELWYEYKEWISNRMQYGVGSRPPGGTVMLKTLSNLKRGNLINSLSFSLLLFICISQLLKEILLKELWRCLDLCSYLYHPHCWWYIFWYGRHMFWDWI